MISFTIINFQKICQTSFQQIIKYIVMVHDMQMIVISLANQLHLANTPWPFKVQKYGIV